MQKDEINIFETNSDILTILDLTQKIGWTNVKEINLYRIIYISSILYTFKYPNEKNIFSETYTFVVSLRGPYSENIKKSVIYLQTNQVIKKNTKNEFFSIDYNKKKYDIERLPNYQKKFSWFEIIIFILGIYGEEKIYDFVFRDPEYQDTLNRNVSDALNLNSGNKTLDKLNKLKEAFEITLKDDARYLDDKKYLELYFQYIFSKIIKGEAMI